MPKLPALIISLFLLSCGSAAVRDRATIDSLPPRNIKSILTPTEVRDRYVNTYSAPIEFSALDEGRPGEEIKVWGKYYCLFDDGIKIPSKYFGDSLEAFTTHNFAEELAILSNNDTIIRKKVSKKDFEAHLSSELMNYGVLSPATFYGYDEKNDEFKFFFKISIPVTNKAVSRILSVNRKGVVRSYEL